MPFNGAGVYSPPGADFPAVTQTVISSTHYNNIINDLATALSLCLTKDGQQTATANIPFGGFRATNVGITAIAGSVGTPAINVSDSGTGLYRSAASELAVTVAGTQRARFDATGLIVTGVVTSSGLITASAGVTTTQLTITTAVGKIVPGATSLSLRNVADNADNLLLTDAGSATIRGNLLVSGAGPHGFGGTDPDTQFRVVGTFAGGGVNGIIGLQYAGTLTPPAGQSAWGTRVQATINKAGSGTHADFVGLNILPPGIGAGAATLTNASTVKIEGAPSVGTNQRALWVTAGTVELGGTSLVLGASPTISVASGSLTITPSVVIAGALLQVGTTPALTGTIGIPNNTLIAFRNAANSSDFSLIRSSTINAITDIVQVGASAGAQLSARSAAGVPTTSDITSGQWTMWRDTSGATTKLYYNNGGALQSVALT